MGNQTAAHLCKNLLFHDLQHFHRAGLDADTAGDALRNRITFLVDHDLHGASCHTSTAANTQLLVDHVYAGLGVLGDGTMLTGFHTFTALDADHRLRAGPLGNDLDAAQILIKFLIKRFRAGRNTLQTSHTLYIFLNSELLHGKELSFFFIYVVHYTCKK